MLVCVSPIILINQGKYPVQMFLHSVRASLTGIAAACAACRAVCGPVQFYVVARASCRRSSERRSPRTISAYAARTNEDFFTDCALLVDAASAARRGLSRSALDTRFLMREGEHSVRHLAHLGARNGGERASLPAAVSYFNYPFGSRHLEAFVLSVARLRCGRAALPHTVLWHRSRCSSSSCFGARPRPRSCSSPIPLFLICAFSFHHLGGNLGHAPGYFVGFIAPRVLRRRARAGSRRIPARLAFAGALGVVARVFRFARWRDSDAAGAHDRSQSFLLRARLRATSAMLSAPRPSHKQSRSLAAS